MNINFIGLFVLLFSFFPPLYGEDTDVIRMQSGSLLRGRLAGAEQGKLAFDDTALGRVLVPLDTIREITLAKPLEMYYQQTRRDNIKTGSLTSVNGVLHWDGQPFNLAGFHRFQRTPFSLWTTHGRLASIFAYTDGNSDTLNYGLSARWSAEHPIHFIGIDAASLFGETRQVRSAQRATFQSEYRYMHFDWAGLLARESIQHDDFKDLRIGTLSFLGITVPLTCDGGDYELRSEAGATYTTDEYKTAKDGEFAGLATGLSGFWKAGSRLRFDGSARVNMSLDNTRDSRVESRFGIDMEVMTAIHVLLRFEHDYDNLPNPGQLREDIRVNMAASWDF
ncbi:MAG: DUF481 domain-containing protein [Planctomycetes bacterium]|nr:DUF481 domain-containing protein [Planctomycetota bacterium]NUQ34405.1 DUF481 domain-containing protein [Planctomycetaceae bacterium]